MIRFGDFEFDPAAGIVYRGAEETLLPPKAAGVLQALLESSGQLATKDELLEKVWVGSHVTESSLTDAVSLLRQVLGDDPRDPTYIQTLHRRGYRFIATVESPKSGLGGAAVPGLQRTASTQATPAIQGELAAGARLGDYEILSTLGAGAMGVVYRARESVLERDVAIKVLRQSLANDPEHIARLQREAKLLAAVPHPNIAAIHSLGEADGIKFPVLELVEGQTLEERLQAGRMDVEQALEVGRKIASAMEAAHDNGIIHRDLKPANVKLTGAGQVKVLDFGLAKSLEVNVFGVGPGEAATASVTIKGTGRGSIVGTVAYMSPEQARGRAVDRQADIWSFGCVLFELLSGRRAFGGPTVTDTLAAIIDREPDWGALPSNTPAVAVALIRRCLQKDAGRRLHHMGDARIEIEEALAAGGEEEPDDARPAAGRSRFRLAAMPWAAGLVIGAALGAAALWYSTAAPPAPVVRSLIGLESNRWLTAGMGGEKESFGFGRPSRTAMALSPDGRHLVYLATDGNSRQLYLRAMDQARAIPMAGTEGASDPFFSPDGQWIGFVADGLKKVPLGGGDTVTVFPEWTESYGASWGDDGTIVTAALGGGLVRGPAAGGITEPLTTLDVDRGETSHRLPFMLPGSQAVLFTVLRGMDWERAEIVVQSLATGARTTLLSAASDPRYVASGHLLFAREGALMAVAFDPQRLETSGEPLMIVEDVLHAIHAGNNPLSSGAAQVAVSATGTLVYADGGVYPEVPRRLVRVDRRGESQPVGLPDRRYQNVRLSPDGRQLAYTAGPGEKLDVYTHDLERDVGTRLTATGLQNTNPEWSADGKWIAFGSNRDGPARNLYKAAADGSGPVQRLTTSDQNQYLASWSVDGVLAFVESDDIWVLPADGEPRRFFESRFVEWYPTFSPDGRWLAYMSDRTGTREIYVRPYPGPDPPISITRRGGRNPVWSRDGAELLFRSRYRMLAVKVTPGPMLDPGAPTELFDKRYPTLEIVRHYDVDPDGNFLTSTQGLLLPRHATQLHVVLNWFAELEARVPNGR